MNKKTIIIFAAGIILGAAAVALAAKAFQGAERPVTALKSEAVLPMPSLSQTSASLPAPQVSASTVPQSVATPFFQSLLSGAPDTHSLIYTVKKGDSLTAISKAYGTTPELLKKINSLDSDRLSIGQKLKTPNTKFTIVVDKSQNTLILKAGEDILKTYVVSTGTGNITPVGVFKTTDKLVNPTWYKSGAVVPFGSPENVLGTRWIGWTKKGFGIHGTTEPDKLGQQVTAGCVRMRNDEVEELYDFVVTGTEVTVID